MIGRLHPKLPELDSLVRSGKPILSDFLLRLCGEAWLWTYCWAFKSVRRHQKRLWLDPVQQYLAGFPKHTSSQVLD